jgi:hypothetical protein
MVLEIPLTNTFEFNDILSLLQSIFVFFCKFCYCWIILE